MKVILLNEWLWDLFQVEFSRNKKGGNWNQMEGSLSYSTTFSVAPEYKLIEVDAVILEEILANDRR